MDRVKGLLTRWREKVFALLVQQKIQEIEDIRRKEDCQKEVCYLTWLSACRHVDWLVHYRGRA